MYYERDTNKNHNYQYTFIRIARVNISDNAKFKKYTEKLDYSFIFGKNVNSYRHFRK